MDWFNAVDTMYRADLRKLNELNIASFDAKLAALETRIDYKLAAIESERRLATQRRWLVAIWLTVMAAVIGLYFRG